MPTNTHLPHDGAPAGNVGFPGKLFSRVVAHVRQTYPFWNMTGGRNHILISGNDRGCCDLYRMGADVQRPIKVRARVCVCVWLELAGPGAPRVS
jgi:hypothetical protein